ncbi:Pc22g15880 [Penicillium rubens Wisconsin 54-1255]|uniref:Pc22g15880 protein n=1 Tax=Penicillium rubens (strain ATCC 28089 / DSM 1075 / NRRL 1951 / Wisconsin 54-1255) TaxID=500485 RepID=B6HQC6_PENRW|nr:Pc22g15880 [Penicillium rubens Wisconsin 54-1255]
MALIKIDKLPLYDVNVDVHLSFYLNSTFSFLTHFHHLNMSSYIITCKPTATDDEVQAVKDHAQKQGGTIGHEYSLIKGFALDAHPHVDNVEADKEVTTQ